jgi:eukaryotic-like serine/threonine-protein kinase
MSGCLAEDDLLALGRGRGLADAPAAEAHLADCATCSALLATLVRDDAPAWDALAGHQLGPYRLEAQIGAGGMGAVYRARDARLDRAVAVKVLRTGSPEARAAAAVEHPAIVAVYDVGTTNGLHYIAMELVTGESLRSVIARGALSEARARDLVLELARGLAAAHARGVVHRDLKPENLIVARGGQLKILDFGLARVGDAAALDATEPSTLAGTAGYMAPEQARGEPTDARTDLFAVGAILYELVTGRRAFDGATAADRLAATLRDTPALDALGALAPIAGRLLAKAPADRFQSAADLAWALAATPAPAARPRPSRRAVLAGAGAAAIAGLGGYVFGRRRIAQPPGGRAAFRQLTFRTGRVFTARFAPEGARVVYGAAWDAEQVTAYAVDLAGGATRVLELPPADVLAVSARGELAASLGRRFVDHQCSTGRLAVLPLGGGAPRPLLDDIQDADFTPDGQLAIVRRTRGGFTLELPAGTPLVEPERWLTHARVSPDGRRVAFLRHPNINDDAGDVVVVDVATRRQRVLADGWSSVAGLAWVGDRVWFTAARTGAQNELHAVTLAGELAPVAQTTGRLRLHDVASDRRALVSVDTWRLRTLVGGTGDERDLSLSDMSIVSDISADGTQLAIGEIGDLRSAAGAYLAPIDGGRPLRLGDGVPLAISPSARWVAVELPDALLAYATASADRRAIAAPRMPAGVRWLDERSLVASIDGALWRLAIDAPPARLADGGGHPALDPARRRCAFVARDGRLHVLEPATGAAHVVPGMFADRVACGWLADPDAIVLRTQTTPVELVRVDPATGATAPLREITPPPIGLKAVDSVVLSSDGARYAYSFGQELSQLYELRLA